MFNGVNCLICKCVLIVLIIFKHVSILMPLIYIVGFACSLQYYHVVFHGYSSSVLGVSMAGSRLTSSILKVFRFCGCTGKFLVRNKSKLEGLNYDKLPENYRL